MKLQEAFGPQISQIYADGSGRHLANSCHLMGEALSTSLVYLRNLRNLRIDSGFSG
ncbi:MAG: hypothetical protein U1A72_15640 [Sulfuritalea sp.]|nr:hypothetical protein [Sulfuritalea sp.]